MTASRIESVTNHDTHCQDGPRELSRPHLGHEGEHTRIVFLEIFSIERVGVVCTPERYARLSEISLGARAGIRLTHSIAMRNIQVLVILQSRAMHHSQM